MGKGTGNTNMVREKEGSKALKENEALVRMPDRSSPALADYPTLLYLFIHTHNHLIPWKESTMLPLALG